MRSELGKQIEGQAETILQPTKCANEKNEKGEKSGKSEKSENFSPSHRLLQAAINHLQRVELVDQLIDGSHSRSE